MSLSEFCNFCKPTERSRRHIYISSCRSGSVALQQCELRNILRWNDVQLITKEVPQSLLYCKCFSTYHLNKNVLKIKRLNNFNLIENLSYSTVYGSFAIQKHLPANEFMRRLPQRKHDLALRT
jgi:hypothetical protein